MTQLIRPVAGEYKDATRRQRGFTLIELSIVLTIIGLIVGGILKGQELINNARIKTQVAQIDSIKSAVLTFQDRYGYLPGDFNNASSLGFTTSGSIDGDGNGYIAASGSTSASAAAAPTTESIMAWPELSATNLLGGYYVPANETLAGIANAEANAYMPGKITGSRLWLATFTDTQYPKIGTLAIRLQKEISTTVVPATGLTAPDMYGLDAKYDDGLPLSGSISVVGSLTGATSGCISADSATGTYLSAASNSTSAACVPLFAVQ